ncbi:MAG TPA: FtsX-like permease family protein [Chitinophagaceae bacterium]|nr:FtsX-like permease family protein [Chitinophagaceae bacterium]
MDDAYNALYKTGDKLAKIFSFFTYLSIFVACLGLFGLAAFSAEQRTREIGIRKVMGASVNNIVFMLSRDILKLIIIAIIIAFPIAWWLMNKWLQGYAYRVDIAWWVFAGTAGLVLLMAWIIVGLKTIKAAIANPTESLRNE